MIVTRAFKIRLYPSKGQANMINKNIGCADVVYNTALSLKMTMWKRYGIKFIPTVSHMYEDFPFLEEADSQALAWAVMNLNSAYKNWFTKLKKGIKEGYPKFKKKTNKGSYKNSSMPKTIEKLIRNDKIFIPKLGLVNFRQDYDFHSLNIKKIRNITVERSNTNKYFCSICCDYEVPEFEQSGNCVGLDLGVKDLIITSDGQKFENKKFIKNDEKKIKHLQRCYLKKKKGSKNQEKARLKLAIAHEKLSNKRNDYLQKLTTEIVRNNSIICIEDLNVKGMLKNHKLAKSIADCSFSMIRSMLDYKCRWYRRQLIIIDRWSSTSKTCSCCGHVMKDWNLGIREWTCPNCQTQHDRDINAAQNILNEGLKILDNSCQTKNNLLNYTYTVGTTKIQACGEDSTVLLEFRSSSKQETNRSLVGL